VTQKNANPIAAKEQMAEHSGLRPEKYLQKNPYKNLHLKEKSRKFRVKAKKKSKFAKIFSKVQICISEIQSIGW